MKRMMKFFLALTIIWSCFSPAVASGQDSGSRQVSQVTVAGQQVEIVLPFQVAGFIQTPPDDAVQIATAVRWAPFLEVSISADPVPAGLQEQEQKDQVPVLAALQQLRSEQSAVPLAGHRIQFFGQVSESVSNRVVINLQPVEKEAVVIHEWVVLRGDLRWTFRVSYTPGQGFPEALLEGVVIRPAVSAGNGSGSSPYATQTEMTGRPAAFAQSPEEAPLPSPAWWNGECDTDNYVLQGDKRSAYPLGGVYRGVKACGPRPWADKVKDVLVRFYPGAWGAYEWECVELSLRFMYLAYQTPPYRGNGKDMVDNYPGSLLLKVPNGSSLRGPKPGDILSYGPTTQYGHTAVVSAANIDADGNGTVTVIEQNSSPTGIKTHTVVNWYIQSSQTVSGWLHEPTGDPELPIKTYLPIVVFGEQAE